MHYSLISETDHIKKEGGKGGGMDHVSQRKKKPLMPFHDSRFKFQGTQIQIK
jgi:hypothetical protein